VISKNKKIRKFGVTVKSARPPNEVAENSAKGL
jgi:hypothetical protein